MIGSVFEQRDQLAALDKARAAAAKGIPGLAGGAEEGPAHPVQPGHAEAEVFDRRYLADGHGAESPQAEPPRESPIQHGPPGVLQQVDGGILTPIEMSSVPAVAGHAGALTETLGRHLSQVTLRPPIPGREAR